MLIRLKYILFYFIYWIAFFQIGRIIFFGITHFHASQYDFNTLANAMVHGLWLDASMAGYFTLLFCLLLIIGLFSLQVFNKISKIINLLILIICSLAIVSNAVIYTYWSAPLDFTTLKFLKTPTEAIASINWWYMILPLACGAVLFFIFQFLFSKWILNKNHSKPKSRNAIFIEITLLLFMAGICIIPIRGGIGIVPISLSAVYFNKDIYPNHAAYNPVWNLLFSWVESKKDNHYHFMDNELASKKFDELYKISQNSDTVKWVNKPKPNVVVIILESFLSKLIDFKYHGKEIVPNLNTLSKQGLYFSNLYASGDRSDKGLGAIFSGYPALPKTAMVMYPAMYSRMPSIFKDMNHAGYGTSFYYGGSLDFANLNSYFISSQVQNIISGNDLPKTWAKGKWGIHDKPMFEKLFTDLKLMKQPFFTSLFTLTSHEPFDLPEKNKFGNKTGDEEYFSAAYYTDKWLGEFIKSLQKSALWDNTLVVIVADHGTARMGIDEVFNPEKFHIPMVWTGGVIDTAKIIDKICSQTDIPLLILNQLEIKPAKLFKFSNQISMASSKSFAPYFFNNGVGFVSPSGITIFDKVSGMYNTTIFDDKYEVENGKAYLQILSNDFTK